MTRAAEIEPIVGLATTRTARDATRKADRRREAGLDGTIDVREVVGIGPRRRVTHEKAPQRAVEREPDVVLQEAHDTDVESRKSDAQVQQAAGRSQAKFLL